MPTVQQIPIKYVKSLSSTGSNSLTPTTAVRFVSKLIYEFWGFCVNGGSSLTQPGGIADLSFPPGFQSGSTVLLARGADGSTSFGTDIFQASSVNFTSVNSGSLIDKYLVTWVPGSDSTDDSIYRVTAVLDATHLQVDPHSGGTRRLGNHPCFWDRHGINWRLVDVAAATQLSGWGEGKYMVLNLPAAPTVNPGQLVAQVKVTHHTQTVGPSVGMEGNIGIQVSPSGSWNASTQLFTDAATEVINTWFNGSGATTGRAAYTLIGAGDFLIAEARGHTPGPQGTFTSGSGFHVEVPQRLYQQALDPNPVAWLAWQNATPNQVASTYYNGFSMLDRANVVRQWTTLVRSPMGTHVRSDYTGNAYGTGQWQQFALPAFRFATINLDIENMEYLTTDGILSLSLASQFSAGRARLRRVRFTTADMRVGTRLGDTPGWVHVSNGVLWPWDGSILPQGPWRFGV